MNCAGGMKRGSKETEPYGSSLSTRSPKGCQQHRLRNTVRRYLRKAEAAAVRKPAPKTDKID
jgi:hypothetical protein